MLYSEQTEDTPAPGNFLTAPGNGSAIKPRTKIRVLCLQWSSWNHFQANLLLVYEALTTISRQVKDCAYLTPVHIYSSEKYRANCYECKHNYLCKA